MNVELDEGVVGSDHEQLWGGHSDVEPKADHYVRSKGRSVNGGKRKQIGSGRGSPRARARIALSCAALLGRRRRGESLLRHRMSARVLRMPARGVVGDVTRNERVGRKRRERSREGKNPSTRWRASRSICCEFAAWACRLRAAQLAHSDANVPPELRFLN